MVMKFHFLHPCSFFHLWLFNALLVVFQACEMVENLSMALQAPSSYSHKFVMKLSKYLVPIGLMITQFHCMGKVFKLPKKILLYHYFPNIGCNCETCKGVLMSSRCIQHFMLCNLYSTIIWRSMFHFHCHQRE
jgi:hypothetical protein